MSKSVRREKVLERISEIQSSVIPNINNLENTQNIQVQQEELEELEEDEILELERLQTLGIPNLEISKLKSAGMNTVAGVMMKPRKVLTNYF